MSLKEILKNASGVPTGEYKDVAGGTLYADAPLGTILPFGGAAAPIGWFLCQGQAISRITYADLFAVIGTSFGAGDGSTTFNIPDLREATVKGTGLTSKSNNHLDTDGLTLGEFIDDRIQSHTHTYTNVHNGTNPQYGRADFTGSAIEKYNFDSFTLTSSAPTGRSGITTEVKAVGVNFIIKAKMVALPADLEAAIEEGEKYSTTEVKTNKTWIDGKPIYRKVINKTTRITGSTWTTLFNSSNIPADALIDVKAFASDKYVMTGFLTTTTSNGDFNIYAQMASNITWDLTKFVIEYTKTTD